MAEINCHAATCQEFIANGGSDNGPHFGIIPRRVARLRLPGREHAVLDVIAVHTNRGTGLAHVGLETIARETELHKRKVPARILRLVEEGLLEIVQRGGRGVGGRGHANVYRIIGDEEASGRAFHLAAATEAVAPNGALQEREAATENGALFGSETVPFSSLKGAPEGTPTDIEQKERTDPPSGESRAHERGDGLSDDGVGGKQGTLPPIDGDRERRLKALRVYNPSAAVIEFAAELGVNACDPHVLGKFIDWRIAHNKLPVAIEAIGAAYRNWIRDEATRFARGHNASGNDVVDGGSPKRSNPSDLVVSALNRARTYDG